MLRSSERRSRTCRRTRASRRRISRSSARSAPHNLYVSTTKAYAEAKRRGMPITDDVPRLQFSPRVAAEATTITAITIPFSYANKVKLDLQAGDQAVLPGQRRREAPRRRERRRRSPRRTSSSCGRGTPRAAETSSGARPMTSTLVERGASRCSETAAVRWDVDGRQHGAASIHRRRRQADKAGARQHVVPGDSAQREHHHEVDCRGACASDRRRVRAAVRRFRTSALVVRANRRQVQSHTYTHPTDAVRAAE